MTIAINPQISTTEPDWSREQGDRWWSPSEQLLKSIRSYQSQKNKGGTVGFVYTRINVIQHRFWSMVTGADIPLNSIIGGGLQLVHPNGIVHSSRSNYRCKLSHFAAGNYCRRSEDWRSCRYRCRGKNHSSCNYWRSRQNWC